MNVPCGLSLPVPIEPARADPDVRITVTRSMGGFGSVTNAGRTELHAASLAVNTVAAGLADRSDPTQDVGRNTRIRLGNKTSINDGLDGTLGLRKQLANSDQQSCVHRRIELGTRRPVITPRIGQ